MKFAVMFNGQGAQYQGMGNDFYQQFSSSKEVFIEAEATTGQPILHWINEEFGILSKTRYAQLAIGVTSMAIYRAIEEQLPKISAMGGLSLGEYSALIASGSLSQIDGWLLLQERGELMSKHCETISDCQMIAAINMSEEMIMMLIKSLNLEKQLYIANYNSPKQLVLAGTKEAITQFKQASKTLGFKKILPLKVEGPFHSPYMQAIQDDFYNILKNYVFQMNQTVPVWSNVTVSPHEDSTITKLLRDHLVNPVRWYQIIDQWVQQSITHIIQIGPGNTLSKLLATHYPDVKSLVIDKVEDVQKIEQFIKE